MKLLFYFVLICTSFAACFAQTSDSNAGCNKEATAYWRQLADSGRYNEAIEVLLDSIQKDNHKADRRNYWHVGQLYAFNNEYAEAIEYMKKSTGFFDKIFDREWRLYYNGTIAFLSRNKHKLNDCNEKLWNRHTQYYYVNACRLKSLN